MLEQLVKDLAKAMDIDNAKTRTEIIAQIERCYGQENFARSAYMCEQFLKAEGFQDVRQIPLKCDGKTRNLDCIMPQAWDRTGRSFFQLDVPGLTPEEAMICDTNESPYALGMWSAPSAPEGFSGQVVDWADVDHDNPDVKGKIVMVYQPGFTGAYNKCNAAGAVACLACDSQMPDVAIDDYRWSNGISRQGWYHALGDKRGTFLSITPRKANFIRQLLAEGKTVTGHGIVRTKIYDGVINLITGVIPGESKDEILLIAHIYEPFETDDASGAANAIAVASAVRKLSQEGKLPPLKKTLRVIIGMELYGFSAWFADKENVRKALHAYSFDCVCHISEDENGRKHNKVRLTFDAAPSFTDWILPDALAQFPGIDITQEAGNLSDDTFMSVAAIGIPSNWLNNTHYKLHHSTHPIFSANDWDMGRCADATLATAIAVEATYGKEEFKALLPELIAAATKNFQEKISESLNGYKKEEMLPYFALGRLLHFKELMVKRLMDINKYAPGTVVESDIRGRLDVLAAPAIEQLSEDSSNRMPVPLLHAANMIIHVNQPGYLISQALAPWEERHGFKYKPVFKVYGFCDGKITLADAILKTQYSQGIILTKEEISAILEDFQFLEKYGYITVEKKNRSTPEQLESTLASLGVTKGTKLIVHCAFSALGEIEGGPEAVAKMLMEHVGKDGLLMMPAFNFFKFPEDGVFDPKTTPSMCGALSNAFRVMPGVFRSLNPTHSFCAWGNGAKEITEHHHEVCVLGEGSPLDLLMKEDGYCLAIQCPTAVTYMHNVEFACKVKCLEPFGEEYPVRFPDGSVRKVATWSWRKGFCKPAQLTHTYRLMRRRKLIREADFVNAHILYFKLKDFHECHKAVLEGKYGCAICEAVPRIVDATTEEVRKKYAGK